MLAIQSALAVLGWYERPKDEVPPQEIWHHEERLEEWWQAVEQNRDARMRGMEPIEEAPLVENELTKDLLNRR